MENKAHALAAGAFVLTVLALLIGMAMWLMRDVANTTTYELVSTEAVTGLQPQAAVRYKGVAVGRVTSIALDPSQRGNVMMRIAVTPNAPITRSTYATLGFQGVTGLSFLQLDDEGTSTEPLPPGPNGPPRIPFKPGLLGELTDRAQALIGKLDETADRVNRLLGDDNQAAISTALVEIGRSAQSVQQLAATTQQTITAQFGPGKTDIPGLVRQANTALKSIDGAAQQTRQTVARFDGVATDVKRAVDQVAGKGGVVDQLSDSASTVIGTTLPRIQTLTEDASHTIRRLDRIANTLGENPQSLIYGAGAIPPGPGEPGFGQAGAAAPDTPAQPASR
jgi:phospholipid/cholesterol/gamma-HCH transport system substrate-binding protein